MAELYRQKVTDLAQALQRSDTRLEASEAIRGVIHAIVLTPSQGALQIELRGNLAAMLSAAQNAKRSPEGDLSLQIGWLRGRDLNPRPLGYEPLIAKPPGTAQGSQAHFHWVTRGRGATPDHPKPRQIVPDLSPRNRVLPFSTFDRRMEPWLQWLSPPRWPALARLKGVHRG